MAKLKPWVLVDPIHTHPDTKEPLFRDPDGNSTTDPGNAEPFDSEEEAKQAAEGEPEGWVPRPLDDYWPPKGAAPQKAGAGRRRAAGAPNTPTLTMDDQHAHVTATAEESDELFALFHGSGVRCDLQRRGVGDLDVIDFGRPAPADREKISTLFERWRKRNP